MFLIPGQLFQGARHIGWFCFKGKVSRYHIESADQRVEMGGELFGSRFRWNFSTELLRLDKH